MANNNPHLRQCMREKVWWLVRLNSNQCVAAVSFGTRVKWRGARKFRKNALLISAFSPSASFPLVYQWQPAPAVLCNTRRALSLNLSLPPLLGEGGLRAQGK